ncbi:MAG: T9SS type A sorting domain-containing protein, partial [Bacteroidota bacterium]
KDTDDPSDDYWYFDIRVTNSSGGFWISTGDIETGAQMGVVKTMWPSEDPNYLSHPSYTFTVVDGNDPNCFQTITVDAPESCDKSCKLKINTSVGPCNDEDTRPLVSDDSFTVDVEILGSEGQAWTLLKKVNGIETPILTDTGDGVFSLGSFLGIEGGFLLEVVIDDVIDCRASEYIESPGTCSGCLSVETKNIVCDDKGTPDDPTDDCWSFDLTVFNTIGGTWTMTGDLSAVGKFFETQRITVCSQESINVSISDDNNIECLVTLSLTAPEACGPCTLKASYKTTKCDDGEVLKKFSISIDVEGPDCVKIQLDQKFVLIDLGIFSTDDPIVFSNLIPGGNYTYIITSCDENCPGEVLLKNVSCDEEGEGEKRSGASGKRSLIHSEKVESSVKVFPNPVTQFVNIQGEPTISYTARILDLTGKILVTTSFREETSVQLNMIQTGLYIIQVESMHGDISMHKILINK